MGEDGWLRKYLDDFRSDVLREIHAWGERTDGIDSRVRILEDARAEARGRSRGASGFWRRIREWGAIIVTAALAGYTILRGH